MNKDIIRQFFELTPDTQEELVNLYNKRSFVLQRMSVYNLHKEDLADELASIKEMCKHPLLNSNKHWDNDEYGKMLSNGWIDYVCPDCGTKWTEEFKE